MIHTKRVNRKNAGISTIIAAALLVAMTVIAAVALGSTVLQVPTSAEKPYQLQMSGWASKSANEIKLTHLGGDPINTGVITFKTLIPNGDYEDIVYTIPNKIGPGSNPYGEMYCLSTTALDIDITMRLEGDTWQYLRDFGEDYPGYTVNCYKYANIETVHGTGTYDAPMQAGDTLVIDLEQSFGTGMYGKAEPEVGEQFVVQLYSGSQPITAVTIVLQP
jgi:FlaG/FlaF family flagellin (archaellin)